MVVPPRQFVGGAGGQGTQLIVAAQPALVAEPSEVNLNVKQPVVDVIVPGEVVPVNGDPGT